VVYNTPSVVSQVVLTSGEWEVLNGPIALHAPTRTVLFLGTKETPLERHVYAVSLEQPQTPKLLTTPGFSYSATFNDDATLVVLTYSNVSSQPLSLVHRIVYSEGDVTLEPLTYLTEPKSKEKSGKLHLLHDFSIK
jgi:dipeptidyl-peptidase 9